ncbi:ABC transporter transmembrane domain-containing protein, partial [Asaia sp. As-1742]|uniref:ABC transporter transmembrane domain-containing protein n=1 Tax=Asaia sp. As-1742 TaxID=2608325 RepID=UPI001422B986
TVSGIETVKAMAVETRLQQRWEEQLAGYVGASQSVTSIGTVATQIIQATGKLVTAGTLWLGAHQVMSGSLTVGGLVAFNMLAGRVSQPVLRVAQMYQDFHQTRLSAERLGDILNTPTERSGRNGMALPSLTGAVTFEHVNFRHRVDSPLVLEDISLNIQPGEIIGIVGSSGSGKSTLTKLLQRLYCPERGRVLIDGLDI